VDDALVSALMPTAGRRGFVPAAVDRFLAQDHPDKELVVVDDGADGVADLLPDDPRVVYVRLDRATVLGEKRNIAVEAARGEVLVHWDDDDWSGRHRLTAQLRALAHADICGLDRELWWQRDGRAWRHTWLGRRPWLAGNTLAYSRRTWRRAPFRRVATGEDTSFVWGPEPRVLLAIDDE
jgi:glycosyltransferase involved in cell wall biosynthesis